VAPTWFSERPSDSKWLSSLETGPLPAFWGGGEEKSGWPRQDCAGWWMLWKRFLAAVLSGRADWKRHDQFVVRYIVAPELERMEREGGRSTTALRTSSRPCRKRCQSLGHCLSLLMSWSREGRTGATARYLPSRPGSTQGTVEGRPKFVGRAQGSTKKNAEQDAARTSG